MYTNNKVTPESVANYLRENPEFFLENDNLLSDMMLAHRCGSASSLLARQLQILREKNNHLNRQISEFMSIAKANNKVSGRLHRFMLALIQANCVDEIMTITKSKLTEDYGADVVSMHIFQQTESQMRVNTINVSDDPRLGVFSEAFKEQYAICGRLSINQLDLLFGAQQVDIKSSVFIPLVGHQALGMLAIGSYDPDRYPPGMGLTYLNYMGDIISLLLTKYIKT